MPPTLHHQRDAPGGRALRPGKRRADRAGVTHL